METIQPTQPIPIVQDIPEELKKKWNWGAFLLGFIWGVPHGVWISLLGLVPIVNLIIPFYLAVYGNELAWKNKRWESVAYFNTIQKRWAIAGVILLVVGTALYLILGLAYLNRLNNEILQAAY